MFSHSYEVCTCGNLKEFEELELLRDIIESIKNLCTHAEVIVHDPGSGALYETPMVEVSSIENILSGRSRY
jgi:hypothetical protein